MYIETNGNFTVSCGAWSSFIITKTIIANHVYTVAVTFELVTSDYVDARLWMDGEYIGTVNSGQAMDIDSIGEIGRVFNGQYGDSLPGDMYSFFIHDRALSDIEAQQASINPYAFLIPA